MTDPPRGDGCRTRSASPHLETTLLDSSENPPGILEKGYWYPRNYFLVNSASVLCMVSVRLMKRCPPMGLGKTRTLILVPPPKVRLTAHVRGNRLSSEPSIPVPWSREQLSRGIMAEGRFDLVVIYPVKVSRLLKTSCRYPYRVERCQLLSFLPKARVTGCRPDAIPTCSNKLPVEMCCVSE